jgi:hypothetical protein
MPYVTFRNLQHLHLTSVCEEHLFRPYPEEALGRGDLSSSRVLYLMTLLRENPTTL